MVRHNGACWQPNRHLRAVAEDMATDREVERIFVVVIVCERNLTAIDAELCSVELNREAGRVACGHLFVEFRDQRKPFWQFQRSAGSVSVAEPLLTIVKVRVSG